MHNSCNNAPNVTCFLQHTCQSTTSRGSPYVESAFAASIAGFTFVLIHALLVSMKLVSAGYGQRVLSNRCTQSLNELIFSGGALQGECNLFHLTTKHGGYCPVAPSGCGAGRKCYFDSLQTFHTLYCRYLLFYITRRVINAGVSYLQPI